jgi:hypothetical protein
MLPSRTWIPNATCRSFDELAVRQNAAGSADGDHCHQIVHHQNLESPQQRFEYAYRFIEYEHEAIPSNRPQTIHR